MTSNTETTTIPENDANKTTKRKSPSMDSLQVTNNSTDAEKRFKHDKNSYCNQNSDIQNCPKELKRDKTISESSSEDVYEQAFGEQMTPNNLSEEETEVTSVKEVDEICSQIGETNALQISKPPASPQKPDDTLDKPPVSPISVPIDIEMRVAQIRDEIIDAGKLQTRKIVVNEFMQYFELRKGATT